MLGGYFLGLEQIPSWCAHGACISCWNSSVLLGEQPLPQQSQVTPNSDLQDLPLIWQPMG